MGFLDPPGLTRHELDAAATALQQDPDSDFRAAQNATYARAAKVGERLPGETSDSEAWQRAISAAKTFNLPTVVAEKQSYDIFTRIDLGGCNNLTIQGIGNRYVTLRSNNPAGTNIFGTSASLSNVTLKNLNFEGTVIEQPTAPTRARTYGPNPLKSAVYLYGDLTVGEVKVINNFTIDNCRIYGTSELPVVLSGLRGTTSIVNSVIDNCYDPGFLFCEYAVFTHNRVLRGRDNGVSLSRGCQRILCTDNSFENCCYWGVWVGGWDADAGPSEIIIANNHGKGFGQGGIYAGGAAKKGVISGNRFSDVRRGAVDIPADDFGYGLYLGGRGPAGAVTDYSENWLIVGNTFESIGKGGIAFTYGVRNVSIQSNTFRDIGSQYLSNGTTAITSADTGQNFGILNLGGADVSNVFIQGNYFIDTRATPYMNQPIQPNAAVNWSSWNNHAIATRVPLNEGSHFVTGEWTFNTQAKGASGFRSGASGASAPVILIGPAGSSRRVEFSTSVSGADKVRWRAQADTSAEGGSNAGSNFALVAYGDDGTTAIGSPFTLNRATATMAVRVMSTAGRPSASAAGVGANVYDNTLSKPIWSDGTVWRDAAGTAV